MNKFELYCLIFYTMQTEWEDTKNEDLGLWLSSMSPFTFKDIGSAIPDVYQSFCKRIGNKAITLENSFDIAKEYVYSLNDDYYNLEEIRKAFDWISKESWERMSKKYLSEPHKGDNL